MCTPSPFYSALTAADHRDKARRNPVFSGEGSHATCAAANFRKGGVRQFPRRAVFTATFYFVAHVVLLRTLDQVARVYASRIVADVAHHFCFRKLPCVHLIRQAVRAYQLAPAFSNNAISTKRGRANPRPALIRAALVNLLPKPINDRPRRPFSGVGRSAFWRTILRYCRPIGCDPIGHPANCACQINHRSMLT